MNSAKMKAKPTQSNWLEIDQDEQHGWVALITTKDKFFKILCVCNALLFAYLFVTVQFDTANFLTDLGLQSSTTTLILARRASMFMLGISVLMIGSITLAHSAARQMICLTTSITMLGLACMSTLEFLRGTVDPSILTAAVIEFTLGILFAMVFITHIKTHS